MNRFVITCLLLSTMSLAADEPKRFPPLKVPAGFTATLFACDPLIEYPSVIAAGRRPGALFVAVDYMTGLGTDGIRKSEVRLLEDTDGDGHADRAPVFADGFNSIQGIAYHDETLYVMHAPFLTAVQGKDRKNLLTGLGLTPEQNPVRLHCANGVTVGHDGWLYLAMGDNGVDVVRPEGDRLVLQGGGILRCRYDGRDLHVFAKGLRNIYDVALDAELNVFVRDNENDGGTYMNRLCRSFHGADHGYPYLYADRPDEALPPLADLGLGSSAGGVCYLETQFPPEYRGNLLFCEWGKSVVRYPLKHDGSGFEPVKEFEFAAGDSKDTYPFKPTDVIVQRDGSVMISDYADGQRPKRGRGRIFHIRYDPATAAKPGLDSESYFERWEAQKAIERSGMAPKIAGSAHAKMHAIWALVHIEGPKAIPELLRIAKTDANPRVRAQAIRAIADLADPILIEHKLDAGRGDAKLAKQLAELAAGEDLCVQLEVVVALGRLRWADAPGFLRPRLSTRDTALAHAVMQTLRRCENWPEVVKLLSGYGSGVTLRACAEQYQPTVVDGLIARLDAATDASRRRKLADLLTRVYKKPGPWKYWGYRPGPHPANTERWERTDAILQTLEKVLSTGRDHEVRLAALRSMRREKVPIRPALLVAWFKEEKAPPYIVRDLLAALEEQSFADVGPTFEHTIRVREYGDPNRLKALELYAKHCEPAALLGLAKDLDEGPVLAEVLRRLPKFPKAAGAELFVGRLDSWNAEVRAAALEALGQLQAPAGREPALRLLEDKDIRVRRAAAAAVGRLSARAAMETLLKFASDPDLELRRASLESLRLLKEPRAVPFAVAALSEGALEMTALDCLRELGGPAQTQALLEFVQHNRAVESSLAAVRALDEWSRRTPKELAALEVAIAEVQGRTGIAACWHVIPFEAFEKFSMPGTAPDPATRRTLLAGGAEARVAPGASDDPKMPWLVYADVLAPDALTVEFLASSQGPLEVWLNGKSLHQSPKTSKFQVDSQRFAGKLTKGMNRLVVRSDDFHLRFRRKSAKADHEKLTLAALARTGNADRGRKIFLDKEKSWCLKCHRLGEAGERIGPELTGVGGRFSRIHVIESILDPSRTIAASFGAVAVSLKNGKVFSGVKVADAETTLTLADNQGVKHVLAKADIEEVLASVVSSMPEELEKRLSEDEFVDLIAFLMSQKERSR